ncbi:DUF5681 domain-containing protein [Sinorhizobium fredii]|uniref:DUF5681 domain-containing protein n=1 Tax=Rhizobium fredii TaxID=380 RepID=UPI0035126A8D
MTDVSQPEWMKGFVPAPAPPGGRWQKGQSGNPAGRPKGSLSKRDKIAQTLNDDGPEVARVIVDAALAGDIQAAGLVLSRVLPPMRAQAERVQFDLSPEAPLSDQAQEILQAVSEGKLDADTARILIGCIQSVAGIRAVEELEQRIITLEAKQI